MQLYIFRLPKYSDVSGIFEALIDLGEDSVEQSRTKDKAFWVEVLKDLLNDNKLK